MSSMINIPTYLVLEGRERVLKLGSKLSPNFPVKAVKYFLKICGKLVADVYVYADKLSYLGFVAKALGPQWSSLIMLSAI